MQIGIIGAPVDLGADRRGVDMGTSAIRYAGLEAGLSALGLPVKDFGNIAVPIAETTDANPEKLKYLLPIVRMAEELAGRVSTIVEEGYFPLTLGGDHSVALGSLTGVARHRKVGVIWFDAHGDFNSPATTPSGNIHGMVLSSLAGEGDDRLVHVGGFAPKVAPGNIALVGTRDLDPGERLLLQEKGVHVFSMYDVDRRGLSEVVALAIEAATAGTDGIHLSLDLDVVDPAQAPGVGTPVYGGLSLRETHLGMELLAETGMVTSMDVVEVNPVLDSQNATAILAMQFVLSALGKRII